MYLSAELRIICVTSFPLFNSVLPYAIEPDLKVQPSPIEASIYGAVKEVMAATLSGMLPSETVMLWL